MTSKILAALTAVLLLGVATANSVGAVGRPWWCGVHTWADGACDTARAANDVKRTVEGAGHAAGATVEAGQQSGRVVVNATELTGTVLGKTADALEWANQRAAEARIPTRTLRFGECVDTTAGRYCRPGASATTRNPLPRVGVGTCVVDSHGTKWCVVR